MGCWVGVQHLAAAKGHTECVALLVREGATINVSGESGPLHWSDFIELLEQQLSISSLICIFLKKIARNLEGYSL